MPTCHQCNKSFRTLRALNQHDRDSPRHNVCEICDEDCGNFGYLNFHYREYHWGCHFCNYIFGTQGERREHMVDEHDVCPVCDRKFSNQANMLAHKIVHQPANLECWNCYAKFKSPAGMFIHLEAGTQCNGGIDRVTILDNILKCQGPWRGDDDDCPFQCPTCDRAFAYVSGFLQHIESSACDEGYTGGRRSVWGLLRQLRRNLGWHQVWLYGERV